MNHLAISPLSGQSPIIGQHRYDYQKSLEEIKAEYANQGIEAVIMTIYDRNALGELERRDVLFLNRANSMQQQKEAVDKKVKTLQTTWKTASATGNLVCKMGQAAFEKSNPLIAMAFAGGSIVFDTLGSQIDSRNQRKITQVDHEYQSYALLVNDAGSERNNLRPEKYFERQAQMADMFYQSARTAAPAA